jgi:ankyrin repeat protein
MRLLTILLFHSPRCRCTAVSVIALVMLVWGTPALCGQIHEAAKSGDLAKVKTLVKANPALVFSKDSRGYTALHLAAFEGYDDIVVFLLANKANVNARSGSTRSSRPHEVEFEQGHGLALVLVDLTGQTPLHLAAQMGQKDIAQLLLANKADVNAKDSTHSTPLHEAAKSGVKELVELLLANKADINAKDINGHTPLHVTAANDRMNVVELLRQHGGHE